MPDGPLVRAALKHVTRRCVQPACVADTRRIHVTGVHRTHGRGVLDIAGTRPAAAARRRLERVTHAPGHDATPAHRRTARHRAPTLQRRIHRRARPGRSATVTRRRVPTPGSTAAPAMAVSMPRASTSCWPLALSPIASPQPGSTKPRPRGRAAIMHRCGWS